MNPAFFQFNPDAEFDSFVTIGLDGPAVTPGALSTVGINFESWTERTGIEVHDGAVFFMVSSFAVALCSAPMLTCDAYRSRTYRIQITARRTSPSSSCS